VLRYHSNANRAPIANPPNSAQLGGSLYHAPKLHPGPYSSVGVWPRTDRQTQTDTQSRVTIIHFASSTTHAKCNNRIQCNTIQYNTIQIYIVPKVRQGRWLAVNHAVYNTYRRQRTVWSLSGIYKKRVRRETKGWVQEIRTYRAPGKNRVHLLPGRSPGVVQGNQTLL